MSAARTQMKALLKQTKPWLRDAVSELLRVSTLTKPALHARNKLSIVTFHRVLPAELLAQYPVPGIAVTPDELDYLLSVFREHYSPGPLADVAARFQRGERPDKPLLAVTFDDGQRDNLTYAVPVLAKHDVRASFFVVTEAVESGATLWHDRIAYALTKLLRDEPARVPTLLAALSVRMGTEDPVHDTVAAAKLLTPDAREQWLQELESATHGPVRPAWDGMLNWQELREMAQQGHEIGSHSASHPILPLVPEAELEHEIAGSRQTLSQQLGREVVSFCYPNGDHDERVIAAVQRAGYRHAVTTRYGINPPHAAQLALKRFDIQGRYARAADGSFRAGGLLLRLTGQLPGAH